MYWCITYLILLFLPLISGNNTSTSNNMEILNKTISPLESHTSGSKETKLEILSEGGSILPVLPKLLPISLPKENHTNLISLDKEIGKTKEKPVVPRKGVIYNPLDDSSSSKGDFLKDRLDTTIPKAPISNSSIKIPQLVKSSSISDVSKGSMPNVSETTIKMPTKPLVLSFDALNAIGKKDENVPPPKIETSSKSIVVDQLPTPNVKMQTMRHPGMVMPVVITMLVVPMFAVLGYMALRRGQEAWKNRHYKRMDFLLDGMYND